MLWRKLNRDVMLYNPSFCYFLQNNYTRKLQFQRNSSSVVQPCFCHLDCKNWVQASLCNTYGFDISQCAPLTGTLHLLNSQSTFLKEENTSPCELTLTATDTSYRTESIKPLSVAAKSNCQEPFHLAHKLIYSYYYFIYYIPL